MNADTAAQAAGKSDAASLDNLRDIVGAPPVPWWPPAPGWWILAAVLLVLLAVVAWHLAVRWRRNAYRRTAREELDRLADADEGEAARVVATVDELLKRTALSVFPREEVAPLSGVPWCEFLDATGGTDAFTQGPGRMLADGPFLGAHRVNCECGPLIDAARRWIEGHRVPAGESRGRRDRA